MVGQRIRGRFPNLDVGGSFELTKNRAVQVVGVFEDAGSSTESEVWGDLDVVRSAFGLEGSVSAVRVRLPSPAELASYKAEIAANRNLEVTVASEAEYYRSQSANMSLFVKGFGFVIAFLFSLGAMLGAMITMHAAVANRRREIGTMRALGFSRGSVLASFLFESVILSLVGGIVGVAASLAMTLVRFSTMNFATWSEVVFSFEPTPRILLTALVAAGALGVLGGVLPAFRASRIDPAEAMRS
jgi:putative ABC transport system permease protein